MSEFKKCKVIMLPTNELVEYRPGYFIDGISKFTPQHPNGKTDLTIVRSMDGMKIPNPQHLYVISNEEIKLGDYYYRPGFNEIFRGSGFVEGDSKVVASTEKLNELPQIPQSFIKQYCEAGGIDEIDMFNENIETDSGNYIILKPTIKPIKESWTREEVEEVVLKVVTDYTSKGYSKPISHWIKQNL